MNNLYDWGLSEYLLYGWFKWLKTVDEVDVMSISEKSSIGYIYELDLEYPDELHDLHNDYPLALEKLAVSYEMLSDYCKEIADEYGIKVGDVKKLIPNFGSKTKYVLHYKDLHFCLSLGIKLTKIHRVLKFKQSDWMKKCIDFNTEKRKMQLIVLKKIPLNQWLNLFMAKHWETYEKESKWDLWLIKKIFRNTLADQHILLIKSLLKIMLQFMKLNQF